MPTEFRPIKPSEVATTIALWYEVFCCQPDFFESLLEGEPGWDMRQSLVAVEDGEIVSSVHIFLRDVWGLDGNPLRVGCIGSVSTREASRGRGYSGTLLKMAIETMRELGCDFSWLFTGTHGHYRRFGWMDLPTRKIKATQVRDLPASGFEVLSEPSWDAHIAELSDVHVACHQGRPLTTLRSPDQWRRAIHYRANPPVAETRILRSGGQMIGYLFLSEDDGWPDAREFAWRPGYEAEMTRLLAETATGGRLALTCAIDETTRQLLDSAFGEWHIEPSGGSMVMPIRPTVTMESLQALFENPASVHLDPDAF